jgi:hypothetical protein
MILDHFTARNKKAAENNGSNDLLRPDPTRQAASNQPWTNAQERSHLRCLLRPGSRVLACRERKPSRLDVLSGRRRMARRVEHGAIDRQSGDGRRGWA